MIVSNKAVSRLSFYRSALSRFKAYGSVKIYSCDLADALGYTAAQVRKDFSMFGFTGKKKVGYDVNQLIKNIDQLLRKNHSNAAVLCGNGNGGPSLFIDQLLAARGISIVAAFDDQPKSPSIKSGNSCEIPILPFEKLFSYVLDNTVNFGIIAVPGNNAQRMLDMLVLSGIKGVLNLSGSEIKAPKRCIVNTVSVVKEFDKIVYFVNNDPD